MVKRISRSLAVGCNWFNPRRAAVGWVNEVTSLADLGFHTGEYIEVEPGDVITFGAAVTTQGWHIVAYNQQREPYPKVTVHSGISIYQQLDEETAIMQYIVSYGVKYIRMICDTRYLNAYLVTKNRVFSAEEYRGLMASPSPRGMTRRKEYNRDGWTVILNIQGRGEMTAGEQTFFFEPGTVVCVPPKVPFQKKSQEGFLDIQLVTDTFVPAQRSGNRLIVTNDDKSQSVEALMLLMLRIFWEQTEQNKRLLSQLYHTVEEIILYQMLEGQPQYHQVKWMMNVMQTDFSNPDFSLEEIFADHHYCPNHLRRLFKKETGRTPLEYLINLRIHHAKKLMEQNEELQASIAQIALLCGFRDPCYFSRIFKKKEGVSPAQYMKSRI